jgi:hypothetical protein
MCMYYFSHELISVLSRLNPKGLGLFPTVKAPHMSNLRSFE